jgi:hypothetical protein
MIKHFYIAASRPKGGYDALKPSEGRPELEAKMFAREGHKQLI